MFLNKPQQISKRNQVLKENYKYVTDKPSLTSFQVIHPKEISLSYSHVNVPVHMNNLSSYKYVFNIN